MLHRDREIGVVGLGYVGLPLAVAFAEAGLSVVGIEKDPQKLAALDTYDSYVEDVPAERLQPLVTSGELRFTEDFGALKEAEAVVMCLPTPLNEHREPDLSILTSGARDVAHNLRAGALVALESTTYPGTTREVLLPIIEEELKNGDNLRGDGHQVGRDFYLAFAPERIDPGNRRYTIHNIPKIVGGMTQGCTQRAAELYGTITEEVHPVSSPESAEMAKLLENIFRGVNIALVNELALLCDRMDVDVWEVIEAAKTKPFGFMPFYPGPGLGGHCIPIDPFYLSWRARAFNLTTEFIELAGRVNVNMPYHAVGRIASALNRITSSATSTMSRRELLIASMTALFTMCVGCRTTQILPPPPDGDGLRGAYADSAYLAQFGSHNHYLDGWRAYEETVSAARFINGIGAVMPPPSLGYPPEEVARMLAEHGFTRGRLEIPWDEISVDESSEDLAEFDATLSAMRKHGIRPIILLNAHHGGPAPTIRTQRTVTADAAQGDITITVNDASGLKPHYSGPQLDGHAPTMFVTEIDGGQLMLSKPLPEPLSSEQGVDFVTLKYRPFSKPGSREQQETVAGWRKYNSTVAAHVAKLYGTRGQQDVGFDLEVWNELTFGSDFLDINHYYDPPLRENYDDQDVWNYIPQATAQEAEAHPEIYSGATITNGFSNTIPWPASSELPQRLGGLSKHPYPLDKNYPEDEPPSQALDENLQSTDFVPSYHSYYPESGLGQPQTETLARDGAPFDNDINGVVHGRYASGKEVPLYLTEINYSPSEVGISDPDVAMDMKAKSSLRLYSMYLTRGAAAVYLFAGAGYGGETGLAILTSRFLDQIESGDYPANPDEYSGPIMQSTKRLTDEIKRGADMSLSSTRQVKVASITDTHGATQWAGSGSHPPLYDREVFAVLPIQRSTNSFVVPFYVVTRDMGQDYNPKDFTIRLDGIDGNDATVKVLDPLTGQETHYQMHPSSADYLTLTVEAENYPRLISIEEG